MYYLMNKNAIAASFQRGHNRWHLTAQNAELPLGKFEINGWLEDRKAYKHNHHLKQLMIDCGCETTEGFIKVTHAASINDSFWVKKEGEEIAWNDISFYRNDFNEGISKLAFEGLGLYGVQMSNTSPELTTDGSFRKCWKKKMERSICIKEEFQVLLMPDWNLIAKRLRQKLSIRQILPAYNIQS